MSFIRSNIPNAITSGNLLCGCLGIVSVSENNLEYAFYFTILAAILDFFDGFAARMLKVQGELGKQLDSLADMVTFGVLPGYVMFKLIGYSLPLYYPENNGQAISFLPYAGFLITIFSALRLARFNIDTRQTDHFIGVPTPANAFFIGSLGFILFTTPNEEIKRFILNPWLLTAVSVVTSFLMVAELPLIALKFKTFDVKSNVGRYVLVASSLITFLLFKTLALPFIILLYVVISILFKPKK